MRSQVHRSLTRAPDAYDPGNARLLNTWQVGPALDGDDITKPVGVHISHENGIAEELACRRHRRLQQLGLVLELHRA